MRAANCSGDTAMASRALVAYSVGLAGYANIKVLVPAFYALGDARTPALVSCGSILVNAGLNWLTIYWLGFGHEGLALATSAVAILNLLLLFFLLRRRIGGLVGLGDAFLRIGLASLGVMAVCAAVKVAVGFWTPVEGFLARAVVVGIAIPLGAVGFAALAARLGVTEATEILRRLARLGRGRKSGRPEGPRP